MHKRQVLAVFAVGGAFALACGGSGEEALPPPPEPPPIDDPEPEPVPVPEPDTEPDTIDASALPFEFPTMTLDAQPGQFVLTPSRSSLDDAITTGGRGTFIYYGAEMVSTGPEASVVRSLSGSEYSMPNAMIIPIRRDQTAQKGDILLGQWESGSGLQRAIVVGGTPTEPVVRYLDITYDNPSGWGQKDDTFQPSRFHVLSAAGEVGATVACRDGSGYDHGILAASSGDQILVSGFAASLKPYNRADCVDVTPRPQLAVGDTVHVPVVGSYTEGSVTEVLMSIGRVKVSYSWGGSDEEKVFSVSDVTPGFDGPAPVATRDSPDSAGRGDDSSGKGDSDGSVDGDGDSDGNGDGIRTRPGNGGNFPIGKFKGKFKGKRGQ